MRSLLILALFLPLSALAEVGFDCADVTTHSVADVLGLKRSEPLWQTEGIEVDPSLAPLSSQKEQKVNLIIYPHGATIDWIFQTDVGDLKNYPEYAEEIEQSRVEGMKMIDTIADVLFDGDKEKATAHVQAGNPSLVQQYEFEKRHMLPYVNSAGAPSVQRQQISRQSEKAWVVYDISLKEAVQFAQFFKTRRPAWLDRMQIFAIGAYMTDCETGQCSIKRD